MKVEKIKNIIGVDLGGTNVRAGRIEGKNICAYSSQNISSKKAADVILNEVKETISKVLNDSVEAIGIGVPSTVDVDNGIVYDVHNIPSWKEIHLKEIIENSFNIPTFINNDANCFTLGEKHYGKGKKYKDFVGLILGTGIGAGIIVNDNLYSGKNCGSGEFGMIPYKESILEDYCCGQFFKGFHNLSGEELSNRAIKNDPAALEIFENFGSHIGAAIKIIMYTFDPEAIILGGSVSKAYPFFKESLFKSLENFPYTHSIKNLTIELSESDHLAIRGATSLYLDHLI